MVLTSYQRFWSKYNEFSNYLLNCKGIVVYIYQAAKGQSKYSPNSPTPRSLIIVIN